MDLVERIFPGESPQQCLYIAANRLRLYSQSSGTTTMAAEFFFDPKNPSGSNPEISIFLQNSLRQVKTGILFDPHYWIFNLFNFEKLPLSPKTRHSMIEWRLQKVFPEKLEQYLHHYFRISAKQYWSTLISREINQFWENLVHSEKSPLIFSGNSTVEIINKLFHRRKPPDFFIEITPTTLVTAFFRKSRLLYCRKTKHSGFSEILDDLTRTLQFLNSQYSWKPESWFLIDLFDLVDRIHFTEAMKDLGCIPAPISLEKHFFIPIRP